MRGQVQALPLPAIPVPFEKVTLGAEGLHTWPVPTPQHHAPVRHMGAQRRNVGEGIVLAPPARNMTARAPDFEEMKDHLARLKAQGIEAIHRSLYGIALIVG